MTLKEIALQLLGMWHRSELSVICEVSGNIKQETEDLGKQYIELREKIMRAEG